MVFKSTIMPEWWNQRAQPWVHYVPVGLNYGDLVDALVFVSSLSSDVLQGIVVLGPRTPAHSTGSCTVPRWGRWKGRGGRARSTDRQRGRRVDDDALEKGRHGRLHVSVVVRTSNKDDVDYGGPFADRMARLFDFTLPVVASTWNGRVW